MCKDHEIVETEEETVNDETEIEEDDDDDYYDDEEEEETHKCECSCGCDEDATTREEGTWLCDQCADYSVSPDGEIICANMTMSFKTCHVCGQAIDWGPIHTGSPNYQYGDCECGKSAWKDEDRGGWGHYRYAPPEPEEDDDE